MTTHRMSGTRTYSSWVSMKQRCLNPKTRRFEEHGGRGIKVCDRWLRFENFLADMGERPAGTTIDRYPDKNGNYEPGNCRWATPKEQMNNTRRNKFISFQGKTLSITQWANEIGMCADTLGCRLDRGWPVEVALSHPVQKYMPHLPNGKFEATR